MQYAKFPPEIEEITDSIEKVEQVISSWDMIYKMNLSGGVGSYQVQEQIPGVAAKAWSVMECVPVPNEIGLGVGWGMCNRFLDKRKYTFKVFPNMANTGPRDGVYQTGIWIRILRK